MPEKITVFGGLNAQENVRAIEALKRMEGVVIEAVSVAGILDTFVRLPFIETPDGRRHYGVDSIERFVREHK